MDGSPPGSPIPGILQAREWRISGVGCHFLLQCMKVKSESEVAQSCLTLRDPMDCSLPGSSVHGIFQARVLEWGAIAFFGPKLLADSKSKVVIQRKELLYSLFVSFIVFSRLRGRDKSRPEGLGAYGLINWFYLKLWKFSGLDLRWGEGYSPVVQILKDDQSSAIRTNAIFKGNIFKKQNYHKKSITDSSHSDWHEMVPHCGIFLSAYQISKHSSLLVGSIYND